MIVTTKEKSYNLILGDTFRTEIFINSLNIGPIFYEVACCGSTHIDAWEYPKGMRFSSGTNGYAGLDFHEYLQKLFGMELGSLVWTYLQQAVQVKHEH